MEAIGGFFHLDHRFQFHIGAQIHSLVRQMVSKFRTGNFNGAGDILHLGGVSDLTAEAVFLNDQDGLACPKGINRGSQAAGAAADNDNIMHGKFLRFGKKGRVFPALLQLVF